MDGYKGTFDKAIATFADKNKDGDFNYDAFRSEKDIYGFLDNGDKPCDEEADNIAKTTDADMYEMYRAVLRDSKKIGYTNSSSRYSEYTNLDSRHIMMFILLFSKLPEAVDSIVEIGGGFGNWLTLNRNRSFNKWTIIDLPHVGRLQEWYLTEQGIDKTRYDLVSAFDYDTWAAAQKRIDLVIGSHSLSELSINLFYQYFIKVIRKAKYLYYCNHIRKPTPELIESKRAIIENDFTLVRCTISECGTVANSLYVSKLF